ncbi:MAG: MFS transporter [Alphaproteobacteria bacterium]|nr:MFS transporter [Alphaproteobacteria bacterium]
MDGSEKVFTKAAWRLLPFMVVLYVFSFLDRVNVGFAALTMNEDLSFTPQIFGFGAGIFFFGYFLFEMPSNLILARVGARLWMFRIMLTWGLVSMATAFVTTPMQFYAARFLLGVAEAGFFPGMILYLTYWFPAAMRARFFTLFLVAVPLANVIGAPVSGIILGADGVAGLQGWQWLFLIEGLPSCLLAFAILFVLPDGPAKAAWLTGDEKAAIAARLSSDPSPAHERLLPMLKDARIWLCVIPYFGIVLALYGLSLWLPQIVKAMGYSNVQTGFIVAVPYVVAMAAMIVWSRSSDTREERVWHVAIAAALGAIGLGLAALIGDGIGGFAALIVAMAGVYAALGVYWTLPTSILGGVAAAGGIALINSIANLGGFFGPALMGTLKQMTGDYRSGMAALAVGMAVVAVVVFGLGTQLPLKSRTGTDT